MLVALGVMAVTVGGCSAPLALKLQNAFFSMIRNIVLLGVVERVEVLIVAVWVITDFTLIAAAVMTAAEIWRGVLEARRRTAFVYPTAAAATALAFLIAPNAFRLRSWSEIIVPLVNMSFTLLIIPLTLVIGRLRKKI